MRFFNESRSCTSLSRVAAVFAGVALLLTVTVAQAQKPEQRGIFGAGQPGEVSVVRLEAKKMGLKDFQMQSRSVDGRLAIDSFTSRLGSGILSGTGKVDWSRPNDVQAMRIQFQNVETMALLKAFDVKLDATVQSMASGVINVRWQGVRGSLPRQTMNGTVQINFGPGYVTNADVLTQLASVTGIRELQQFEFNSGHLSGTITNGMMAVNEVELEGPTKATKGKGLLDLRTEQVQIRFDGYVSPAIATRSTQPQIRTAAKVIGKLAGKEFSKLVRLPIPIVMYGRVRDPQFSFSSAGSSEE